MKIFAVNFNGERNDKAEELGEIIYMTSGYIDMDRFTVVEKRIIGFVNNATSEDVLMLSGHMLMGAVAVLAWFKRFGNCRVLQWSKEANKFNIIDLTQNFAKEITS